MDEVALRTATAAAVDASDAGGAARLARRLIEARPGLPTYRFLRRRAEAATFLPPYRLALLSSFSVEFLHDALIAHAFAQGLCLSIHQTGFNTFRQEILAPDSDLYAARCDAVILAVDGQDWVPDAYGWSATSCDVAAFQAEVAALVAAFRKRCGAPLLIHNLAPPPWPRLGILDSASDDGQAALIARLNEALRAVARSAADVHVVDYAGLVSRHGSADWFDERMRHYAGAPIRHHHLGDMAREHLKYIRALTGRSAKCLVTDLDNTLWGGVLGEDGPDGIRLGPTYPGSAFREFQEVLVGLAARGVILAVASKNNPADVDALFDRHHPHMRLGREHFACLRVGWQPKPDALRDIARTLNIGLEHMVFMDDSAAECEQVRQALPMVEVIHLPPEPERFAQLLLEGGLFETLSLSAEDRARSTLYRARAEAEALKDACTDVAAFLDSLGMRLTLAPLVPAALARAGQLTRKTNQFNATTWRLSDGELEALAADPAWIVMTAALTDRFGDHGIIGLAMARHDGATLDIAQLLLSCRVIGRGVETAMLAELCHQASQAGCGRVVGRIVPTAKNVPARDLYRKAGFSGAGEEADGSTRWVLDPAAGGVEAPAWFHHS
jgi:FkbH-like protein